MPVPLSPPDDERSGDQPTLGAELRAARETAGRTVEQVSESTRIRATLIRDLESDNFASSGGAVYARGHLRAIGAAIGVDAAPLVKRFDAEHGSAAPVLIESTPIAGPVGPASFGGSVLVGGNAVAPERTGPRWGLAVAGAAALLVGFMAIGQYSGDKQDPTTVAGGQPTATSTPTPKARVIRTPDPNSVASKPPVTGAQLRLRLIGGDSWVSVANASATLFEGVMKDGQFKDFNDATRLRVIVGNASAVNLNCGGRDSGPAGAPGAVRRFACTAAGLGPA